MTEEERSIFWEVLVTVTVRKKDPVNTCRMLHGHRQTPVWIYKYKSTVNDNKERSVTMWFKYDRDKLWLVYTQIVPVIFKPPCTYCLFNFSVMFKGEFVTQKRHICYSLQQTSENSVANVTALCNPRKKVAFCSSELIFTFLHAGSSIKNVSEQFVSWFHLSSLFTQCHKQNSNTGRFWDSNSSTSVTNTFI
jgi:hypothetical protein